jgi:hypothetical protein
MSRPNIICANRKCFNHNGMSACNMEYIELDTEGKCMDARYLTCGERR